MWDWTTELATMPELLAEKVKAPSVVASVRLNLVIDPTNLWLIHSRIHRARNRIRPRHRLRGRLRRHLVRHPGLKLGTMRYGSPAMTVTADRTVEYGLATVGYDDRGVAAELGSGARRAGDFVGYQLDRVFAPTARPGPVQRVFVRRLAPRRSSGWPT